MITTAQLDSWLGKGISEICTNGYADNSLNHCAHFVSHALGLRGGYTCRHATGGRNTGASLRVHEIFGQSSGQVEILQCSNDLTGLIFVSRSTSFRTHGGTPVMANVPKKHIGILAAGFVWHYSNTRDQVVKQTMSSFLGHYPGQVNSLWYAEPPAGYRTLWFGQC